jgi:nucleoside-diphosphate-sugar epimerase
MRVLVTGAAGFIGLNIVEALISAGHEAIGLDRAAPPPGFSPLPFMQADIRDVGKAFEKHRPDGVIHAAALTPGRASERQRMADAVEVNIAGTVHVMEAAANAGCRRVLFVSSAAVYGASGHGKTALDEESTLPAPVSLYGITKLAAERLALRYRELANLDVVAARLAAAFGPWERETEARDTPSPFYQTARLARRGEEAILPRRSNLDWIYSREAAADLVALLTAGAGTVFNVGPRAPYDLERFCAALAKRYPKFRWRSGAPANIDLYGAADRSPLSIGRLEALGFARRFDADAAYAEYLDWLERQ